MYFIVQFTAGSASKPIAEGVQLDQALRQVVCYCVWEVCSRCNRLAARRGCVVMVPSSLLRTSSF